MGTVFEVLRELIEVASDARAILTPERAAELHKIVDDLEGKPAAEAEVPAEPETPTE